MMAEPLVSVIIPSYNRRRWIGECLDSVRAQTYSRVETLVIDDGSTDGTVEWLSSDSPYGFARVHVQPENGGASQARNVGVRIAQGELITFIDSDDVLEPNLIETAVEVLRCHPEVGLFCCDSHTIGPNGEVLNGGRSWHEINGEIKRYPVRSGLRRLNDLFVFSNCFPGFTLRRGVFDSIGYLDQSIFPLDDYDLALRVAGAGYGIYYCHEPLARYREHGGNCSGAANAIRVGRMKLRCLRLALERNPELRSLGRAVQHRLADVQVELAVSYLHAGDRTAAARTLAGAVARDPTQLVELLRCYSRRLRWRVAPLS